MCGIVGHLGPQNSLDVVIEGLKRLEYRGYDSAGVSLFGKNQEFTVRKKEGKIANLLGELGDLDQYNALACIGHTRWATHGEVNDVNSHPHLKDKISIVHNGIIENAGDLRDSLIEKGYEFRSQTDSEVFLALVITARNEGKDIFTCITESFQKLDGNSAFVVLDGEKGDIYAVKKGAPLVCGIGQKSSDALVSSDPYALVGVADKIYFPEDSVVCYLSASHHNILNFYELNGDKSKRYVSKMQDMKEEATEKGGFDHFMQKEIWEQPGLIRGLSQYYFKGEGSEVLKNTALKKPEKFHITACGTAFYAGLVIRDFIEKFNQIPCATELASEFRYRNPIIRKNEVGLFISQSGETADTLAAQSLCSENSVETISVVNVEGSTLFRECSHNLLIRAGIEIGVASTKAFTQQILTGRLLSFVLSGEQNSEVARAKLVKKYNLLADRIDELLNRSKELKSIAETIYDKKGFFYTGRGVYYPIALEGALKLKEIAYVHAEGYASGELKHGPIALIDESMVNIAIVGPELTHKTISNIEEIKARKGIIVSLGPAGNKDLEKISDHYFKLNFDGLEELSPLYVNVANQLLAYYMAKFKGTDIDKPRNLAKSVTVE